MKRFPKTKATGKLGVAYVQTIVFGTGSLFREVPEDTDLGIDGYIEFVEDEVATGFMLGVQIKTGPSYLVDRKREQFFEVTVSRRDLEYWRVQPIPTAIVFFEPASGLSGWIDVTEYVRRHPQGLDRETHTLRVGSRARPFTAEVFQGRFKETFLKYRQEADLFGYAELVVSGDPEQRFRGFLGLISHQTSRFSRLTCFLLLDALFDENDRLRSAVSDSLSRYLPHPEVGFVPPRGLRDYVLSRLEAFGRAEIQQLLETAWLDEENLMQRGSLGQSVGVIITAIPEFRRHLVGIAVDPAESHEARWAAIALAAEFGLESVLLSIGKQYDRVDWGTIEEAAHWAALQAVHLEEAQGNLSEILAGGGPDSDDLADALKDAGLFYLVDNEDCVAEILERTQNPIVKFEAQRAYKRIMDWHCPPDQ